MLLLIVVIILSIALLGIDSLNIYTKGSLTSSITHPFEEIGLVLSAVFSITTAFLAFMTLEIEKKLAETTVSIHVDPLGRMSIYNEGPGQITIASVKQSVKKIDDYDHLGDIDKITDLGDMSAEIMVLKVTILTPKQDIALINSKTHVGEIQSAHAWLVDTLVSYRTNTSNQQRTLKCRVAFFNNPEGAAAYYYDLNVFAAQRAIAAKSSTVRASREDTAKQVMELAKTDSQVADRVERYNNYIKHIGNREIPCSQDTWLTISSVLI
jgi:hypothetical protein